MLTTKMYSRIRSSLLIGMLLTSTFVPISLVNAARISNDSALEADQLELWFEREKTVLAGQQERLNQAHAIEAKAQEAVDLLIASGQDPSWLVSALDAFSRGINAAENYHALAGSILSAASGFDNAGHATDSRQALETVRSAGQNLRETHLALTNATIDFRQAVLGYVQASK